MACLEDEMASVEDTTVKNNMIPILRLNCHDQGESKGAIEAEIQSDTLMTMLNRPDVRNLPILVVCVAGAKRSGKSLLVNLLALYLEHMEKDDGESSTNTWLETNPEVSGVIWRQSYSPVTTGIDMWNKPFFIKRCAVILMDCEGLYGVQEVQKTIDAVITLATLELSTIFIMNFSQVLNLADLEQIEAAITEFRAEDDPDNIAEFSNGLLFVFRDWQADDEYGVCRENRLLAESPAKEKLIKEFFREYAEFMLPSPGDNIKKGSATDKIRLQDLMGDNASKKFLQSVEDLGAYIFTTLRSTGRFFKTKKEMCDDIGMLKQYHVRPCTNSPAGAIERRKILKTWKELTSYVFPDFERAADSEDVDLTEKVTRVVEAFKQTCLQYLQAQKENYPGKTAMAVETWSEVEGLMESYFMEFQQRKQVEASKQIYAKKKKTIIIAATSISLAIVATALFGGTAVAAIGPAFAGEVVVADVVCGASAGTVLCEIIKIARNQNRKKREERQRLYKATGSMKNLLAEDDDKETTDE